MNRFFALQLILLIVFANTKESAAQDRFHHSVDPQEQGVPGHMWSDGNDLLVIAGSLSKGTTLLDRNGQILKLPGPASARCVHGTGTGIDATVVVGGDNEVARLHQQRWQVFRGDQEHWIGRISDVAALPNGTIYFASYRRGLHRYDGREWVTFEYPFGVSSAREIVVTQDEQILVLADNGQFYELTETGLIRPPFVESMELNLGRFESDFMWFSQHSERLWIAAARRLFSVNLNNNEFTQHTIPLNISHMTGAVIDGSDTLVMLSRQNRSVLVFQETSTPHETHRFGYSVLYRHDGGFFEIGHIQYNPNDLFLDSQDGTLYVLHTNILSPYQRPQRETENFEEPQNNFNQIRMETPQRLGDYRLIPDEQLESDRQEVEISPSHLKLNIFPVLGVGIYPTSEDIVRFELDIILRYCFLVSRDRRRNRILDFGPYTGFSAIVSDGNGDFYASQGFVLSFYLGSRFIRIGPFAAFLIGEREGNLSLGARGGMLFNFEFFELETSYQFRTEDLHSIRFTLSVHPAAIINAMIAGIGG